jgi:hypothetical protein
VTIKLSSTDEREVWMMDTQSYLDSIAVNSDAALIPITMARDVLSLSRTAVLDLIRSKKLDEVRVTAADKRYRGVTAGSLRAYCAGMLVLGEAGIILERYLSDVVKAAPSGKANDIAINYAPVMEKLGLTWRSPADRATIGQLLGGVSQRSKADRTRGFLLSAVVVLKATGLPSGSFFQLAAEFAMIDEEADEEAKRRFWVAQMRLIAKYYR